MGRFFLTSFRAACVIIFTLALSVNGAKVYTWGCDHCGLTPTRVTSVHAPVGSNTIVDMIFTDNVVYYLDSDGALFAQGKNTYGGLGSSQGSWEIQTSPRRVTFGANERIISFAASRGHSLALTDMGNVYSWGSNGYGQLCLGSSSWTDLQTSPAQIDLRAVLSGRHVRQVAATERTSLLLLSDGSILGCGVNDGPLAMAVDEDALISTPAVVFQSTQSESIAKITVGTSHVIALMQDGRLFAWGDNQYGQLGVGVGHTNTILRATQITTVHAVQVFASGFSSAAIMRDGSLLTWGSNAFGKLGLGIFNQTIYRPALVYPPAGGMSIKTVAFSSNTMFLLFANSAGKQALYAAGSNQMGALLARDLSVSASSQAVLCADIQPSIYSLTTNIVSMSFGTGFGSLVTSDGKIYQFSSSSSRAAGSNRYLLAVPADNQPKIASISPLPDSPSVILRAKDETVLVIENGKARVWGLWTEKNAAGGGVVETIRTTPLQLDSAEYFESADAGNGYVLLRNRYGRLFSAGSDRVCAGCLGAFRIHPQRPNEVLSVGYGAWFDIPVILFAAGTNMAAAVTADQRVWVWGSPRSISLGSVVPVPLRAPNATSWTSMWLGTDTLFIKAHTGEIYVFGSNSGAVTCMSNVPSVVNVLGDLQLTLVKWEPMGSLANKRIKMISLSATPFGAAEPHGTLENPHPQPDPDRDTQAEFGLFVTEDNEIHTCGGNYWGQRGAINAGLESTMINLHLSAGVTPVRVAAGPAHALVLTSDNKILTWGRNDEFQLGLGYANWTRSESGPNGVATPKVAVSYTAAQRVGSIAAGARWSLIAIGNTEPSPSPVEFHQATHDGAKAPVGVNPDLGKEPPVIGFLKFLGVLLLIIGVIVVLVLLYRLVAKRRKPRSFDQLD